MCFLDISVKKSNRLPARPFFINYLYFVFLRGHYFKAKFDFILGVLSFILGYGMSVQNLFWDN